MTTRRLMALVILLGLALGLGLPAYEVANRKDFHLHGSVFASAGVTYTRWAHNEVSPFWPRYWRRVLGRPWDQVPLCGDGAGLLAETCQYARPEIRVPLGNGQFTSNMTPEMRAAMERLDARRAASR